MPVRLLDLDDVGELHDVEEVSHRSGRVLQHEVTTAFALLAVAVDDGAQPGRVHEPDLAQVDHDGVARLRRSLDVASQHRRGLQVDVTTGDQDLAVLLVRGQVDHDLVRRCHRSSDSWLPAMARSTTKSAVAAAFRGKMCGPAPPSVT